MGDGSESKPIRGKNEVGIKVMKPVTGDAAKTAKSNIKIATLINGRAFTGVFALLEVFAFNDAVAELSQDSEYKDYANFLGASAKLVDASGRFVQTFVKNSKSTMGKALTPTIAIANAVGSVATSAMCFWDSFEAFDKRDTDSAMAYAGAGVAFGVSAYVSIMVITGPIGWIAAAIGVGFLILAAIFTDTDMEHYFKNFLLSDHLAFPLDTAKGELPMAFSKRLLKKENILALMGDKDYIETMMQPADAAATLMDYIVCTQITFKANPGDTHSNTYYTSKRTGVSMSDVKVFGFTAIMTFYQFLNREEQVDPKIYFFPYGIKKGGGEEVDCIKNITKTKDEQGRDALSVNFGVPEEYWHLVNVESEMLFVLRLKIDGGQQAYFPYNRGGNERCLGAKVRLNSRSSYHLNFREQNRDVRIAPLSNLIDMKQW